MSNEANENQGLVIDEAKLNKMCIRIFTLEQTNRLSNAKTDSQMKDAIVKIIEQEAKKWN